VALIGGQERAQASFPGQNGRLVTDGITTMNPDGSGQTRLPESGWHPAWSPDGTKIVFGSTRDGGQGDLYFMNADGSNPTRITATPNIHEEQPSWSPDGKRITFEREGQVWKINTDGTNPTNLGDGVWPDWSPDGTKIAFTDDLEGLDEYGNVYTMSPDGSNRTRVTYGSYSDWSPDGTKLVVFDVFESNTGIFTVNADGSGHVDTFPFDGETHVGPPVWSPDGTKVAFDVSNHWGPEGYESGFAVSNPDGSGLTVGPRALGNDIDWGPKPVDTVAPTVKAPTRNLVAASVIADSTVPINLT
jgi:TolB protein